MKPSQLVGDEFFLTHSNFFIIRISVFDEINIIKYFIIIVLLILLNIINLRMKPSQLWVIEYFF